MPAGEEDRRSRSTVREADDDQSRERDTSILDASGDGRAREGERPSRREIAHERSVQRGHEREGEGNVGEAAQDGGGERLSVAAALRQLLLVRQS